MDLASKVIQANEDERLEEERALEEEEEQRQQFYTDDLGFLVEKDIRRRDIKFARYVLFRCVYLNKRMHVRKGNVLYNNGAMVRPVPIDIATLADLPDAIPTVIASWVHKRLLELSPKLSDRMIEVCPGLLWDFENLELVNVSTKEYKTI